MFLLVPPCRKRGRSFLLLFTLKSIPCFLQLFEGMKAFRGVDDRIRLFRPMMNMERMHRSADRSCLPVSCN